MARALAVLVLLAVLGEAAAARAELIVGAGGALALSTDTGADLGLWGGVEISPPGRFGARADVWAFEERVLVEGALVLTLGATRPHLAISAHAGAGADLREPGVAAALGLTTQLGIVGPLIVVLDTTAHVIVWDGRFEVVLGGVLGLGAVF
jgi:hypothetical protein